MSEINKENLSPEVTAYIAALENKVEKLQSTVENLNEMLVKRNKMLFGRSSEKTEYIDGSTQLCFFNEAELEYNKASKEPTASTIEVKGYSRKPQRSKEEIFQSLEHKTYIEKLDESQKICDECGSPLEYVGKDLVRQELHMMPAQAFILDVYKETYKCAECEKKTDEARIVESKPAPLPVKGSMAAASAVAYVMVEKFQMYSPLYRLEQYWKSRGVDLNRNTMARWIILASLLFEPFVKCFHEELMKMKNIHSDETTLRVLKRDGTPTNTKSTMWVVLSGKYEERQIALYAYYRNKSQKSADELLGEYTGCLTSDCYQVYGNLDKSEHSACWAHCRRKFNDAVPPKMKEGKAYDCLQKISKMLDEDKKILETYSSETDILTHRQEKIKPLLDEFWSCLEKITPAPGSALDKAVAYALSNKEKLCRFADSGRLESTNNRAERAIKPFVMARKNFLFADTERGAEASARVFSVIETAKMNNLDVYGYLVYLLSELPKLGKEPTREQLDPLFPWSNTLPDYCKNQSKN